MTGETSAPKPKARPTVEGFRRMLRATSATNHPFVSEPVEVAREVGPAYAKLAHALADYIDACRFHHPRGYVTAASTLRLLIQALPEVPVPTDADRKALAEAETIADADRNPPRPKAVR